jgi:O-antigen/teichoic acid export membrane protein
MGRGTAYIFAETMIGFISGYLLWLILTRITSSEIIGTASTIISLATIFATIATIGVPTGASRFLAKFFHDGHLEDAKTIVKSSLILVILGIICSVAILLIVKGWIGLDLDIALTISTAVIIGSTAISVLMQSIIIASLKTRIIPITMIIASSARTISVIILVLAYTGALGIVIGNSIHPMIMSIILGISIIGLLGRNMEIDKKLESIRSYFRIILKASFPSWLPRLITIAGGANLGTVIVYGSIGPSEAASFFIANTIASGIFAMVTPLQEIAYPALSAMSDGRKKFAWRIIKISFIILSPIIMSIMFYSDEVISLLGQDYIEASQFLKILLLGVLPNAVSAMVTQLVYAYGNYKQVLYLGLASSIPRTVLYFILVPYFGGTGAAASYLVGSMIGFGLSILVSQKIGLIIRWKYLVVISLVPLSISFMLGFFEINFILATVGIILISLVIFLKLNILTETDVNDGIYVLPHKLAKPLDLVFSKVGRVLNKDYSQGNHKN